jgi:hypothetical protein
MGKIVVKAVPDPVKQMSKTILRHTLIKKYFWHFCWPPYLYTFSLDENASFIIVSADIFQHSAKKNRKLNAEIKFYLKCMVPP